MKVIVIGAGAAGLYAGYLLKAQGVEVQVLEARAESGGRVKSDYSFSPDFPIEWGAAYLHGHNHEFFELADYTGVDIKPEAYGDYYYWKGALLSRKEAMEKKKLKRAIKLFRKIYQYDGEEKPLIKLLKGKTEKLPMAILDGLASEYGCGIKDLGAASLAIEDKIWPAKGGNYWTPNGLSKVFEEMTQDLADSLSFQTIVQEVIYSGEGVEVRCNDGKTYTADKAIVTVPLSVLKARVIQFEPSLPTEKQTAIDLLGIGAGMKVFLQFNQQFWPKEITSVFGGEHSPLYEVVPASLTTETPTLKAYIMGSRAQELSKKGAEEVEQLLLQELSMIFGQKFDYQYFIKSKVINWMKEPYIWGAYSFAALNSYDQRWHLAVPLKDSLYFAGEATHFKGYAATVQGAMESASWAVEAILEEQTTEES